MFQLRVSQIIILSFVLLVGTFIVSKLFKLSFSWQSFFIALGLGVIFTFISVKIGEGKHFGWPHYFYLNNPLSETGPHWKLQPGYLWPNILFYFSIVLTCISFSRIVISKSKIL